jgi:hypothetical protein
MQSKDLADLIRHNSAFPNLYQYESKYPDLDAQRNLSGRTYHVDPDTLKYFKTRILRAGVAEAGLVYWIIESAADDYEGKNRVFRPVLFDLWGTVINFPENRESFSARKYADNALDNLLAEFDVVSHSLSRIQWQIDRNKKDNDLMQFILDKCN